jgi:carboxymethylenebutenolidase
MPIPLYEAAPDNDPVGAVVVIQEIFGVNDHIEDVARRFAAAGFHAVAPHLFHRDGVNALPYDNAIAKPHMQNLTADNMSADVAKTLNYLAGKGFPTSSTGIAGFCLGGSVALLAATQHPFGAAVTFYGGGVGQGRLGIPPLVDIAESLRAPWLGLYGDQDPSIPVDDVERLRVEAAKANVPTSIVRYPDAGHAFHCDARPDKYHEASARDAWAKAVGWLGRYLRPRG